MKISVWEKVDSDGRSPFRKVLRSTACSLHLERAQGPIVYIILNYILQHRKKRRDLYFISKEMPYLSPVVVPARFRCYFPLFGSIYMIISIRMKSIKQLTNAA